jgi:hypothetical protein
VSQKGIDFFLNETNPLDEITVKKCGNVNLENMKTMAQEKHWDVKWNVEYFRRDYRDYYLVRQMQSNVF